MPWGHIRVLFGLCLSAVWEVFGCCVGGVGWCLGFVWFSFRLRSSSICYVFECCLCVCVVCVLGCVRVMLGCCVRCVLVVIVRYLGRVRVAFGCCLGVIGLCVGCV